VARRHPSGVGAQHAGGARRRPHEIREQLQRGRLAGAVRAEDAAGRHAQGQAIDGIEPSETAGQVERFDGVHGARQLYRMPGAAWSCADADSVGLGAGSFLLDRPGFALCRNHVCVLLADVVEVGVLVEVAHRIAAQE
jgi:hypothetical protein